MTQQVQNAKRIQKLEHLPPYQTEIVRAVGREVRELEKDTTNIMASFNGSFDPSADPAAACTLLVDHLCMRRNKRCLLAYHRTRTDRLEKMVWEGQDVLEMAAQNQRSVNTGGGQDINSGEGNTSSLSPEEEEYVRQYSELLAAVKGTWTDIDLTGSLEPPRDLFVDVRVLKDAGEIQTEYGCVSQYIAMREGVWLICRQDDQLDQEFSVLCSPGRCRETDCSGLSSKAQLSCPYCLACSWSIYISTETSLPGLHLQNFRKPSLRAHRNRSQSC